MSDSCAFDPKKPVRVRFAPAPTGMMHLGNIRTALINYLLARQKKGTFILRIEDTDATRNFDPGAQHILQDLAWLGLLYDEGPVKGGACEPYYQSQRTHIYQEKLRGLEQTGRIYRCFCTAQELELKRERQIAMKKPPRYDRACLKLDAATIEHNVASGKPFAWRFKLDEAAAVEIFDLARGVVRFELAHFSDFPLTRQDGSFTFLFANTVDDMAMSISHVLRGQEQLSNCAYQAALYEAFGVLPPKFWHLPVLSNIDGKKLSKRDFGFSLRDLQEAGYVPQALLNYLAIIGGSFEHEIMSLDELTQQFPFDHVGTTSRITYDVHKLVWVNHKWISSFSIDQVTDLVRPFLEREFGAQNVEHAPLRELLGLIHANLMTLADAPKLLMFYFRRPQVSQEAFDVLAPMATIDAIKILARACAETAQNIEEFVSSIAKQIKQQNLSATTVWHAVRLLLTGAADGLPVKDVVRVLGLDEVRIRLC